MTSARDVISQDSIGSPGTREVRRKRNLVAKGSRGQRRSSPTLLRTVDFPDVWAGRDNRARFGGFVVSSDGIPAGRRPRNCVRGDRHSHGWRETLRHAVPGEIAALTFNLVVLLVDGEIS